MLINDLIGMLEEIPATLAVGWAVWLSVGLLLSIWSRRDRGRLVVHGRSPRPQAGGKPSSGVRAPIRNLKPVPASAGDAFGELEALLEPPSGTHRTPGDAPMLAEISPEERAPLGAPRSLP